MVNIRVDSAHFCMLSHQQCRTYDECQSLARTDKDNRWATTTTTAAKPSPYPHQQMHMHTMQRPKLLSLVCYIQRSTCGSGMCVCVPRKRSAQGVGMGRAQHGCTFRYVERGRTEEEIVFAHFCVAASDEFMAEDGIFLPPPRGCCRLWLCFGRRIPLSSSS